VREIDRANKTWNELVAAIGACGGFVTGAVNDRIMRFECPRGSTLPKALADIGWPVSYVMSGERWISVATTTEIKDAKGETKLKLLSPGKIATDVFEIRLQHKQERQTYQVKTTERLKVVRS
jgi:hypothetical protein